MDRHAAGRLSSLLLVLLLNPLLQHVRKKCAGYILCLFAHVSEMEQIGYEDCSCLLCSLAFFLQQKFIGIILISYIRQEIYYPNSVT